MEIAIWGFYIIVIGLIGLCIAAILSFTHEERSVLFAKWSLKIALAGLIIWAYGNYLFITR